MTYMISESTVREKISRIRINKYLFVDKIKILHMKEKSYSYIEMIKKLITNYMNTLHLKPGSHISRKDRKHMFVNTFFQAVRVWLGLRIIVMIPSSDLSQGIFEVGILKALKSSLELSGKDVLRWLRPHRDQA